MEVRALERFLPPGCRFLSEQLRLSESNLPDYLRQLGYLGPDEAVSVEKAGDGNINWVRRARVPDGRSWIVKQARPALERFPEYQVDTRRIVFEARYFTLARDHHDQRICPEILHFDERERVLILEDLGDAERLDQRLARGSDGSGPGAALARFLAAVHGATADDPELAARFDNDAMRRLHGDHIFDLPFAENDFPLEPEVAARAASLKTPEFRGLAADAYRRYLEPRGALLHGDVQAGNVLLPPEGPKLLDAEIAHVGDPAFDVATLLAHLALPALASAGPARALPAIEASWLAYVGARGEAAPRFAEVARYMGLELLRRTVGAARVAGLEPVAASLRAIECGERWVRTPPGDPSGL
jgi:5-methylthioribose kinase